MDAFDGRKKAQLFTVDFLIAVAVLSAVIGFTLHSAELSNLRLSNYAELQSNSAEVLADANLTGKTLAFAPNSCTVIKNTTHTLSDNCTPTDFNNDKCANRGMKNVFVARRISRCPSGNSACLLEVRTCE